VVAGKEGSEKKKERERERERKAVADEA